MNAGRELIILGVVMLFLFILGVSASVIFVRQWRKEKGKANITIKSLCKLLTIHNLSVEEFFYLMYKEYKETKKA